MQMSQLHQHTNSDLPHSFAGEHTDHDATMLNNGEVTGTQTGGLLSKEFAGVDLEKRPTSKQQAP